MKKNSPEQHSEFKHVPVGSNAVISNQGRQRVPFGRDALSFGLSCPPASRFVAWPRAAQASFLVLLFTLLAYPFYHSFLGIDMGDTGFHVYHDLYLLQSPDIVGMSSFLTDMIGGLWLRIFPFWGLWGLNFLEVLLEYFICAVVYINLRHYLYPHAIMLGLCLASIASRTYLNTFNYHQLHAILVALILICIFRALQQNSYRCSLVAGIIFILDVGVRMASVTLISSLGFYCFWLLLSAEPYRLKKLCKHITYWFMGSALMGLGMLLLLRIGGLLQAAFKNVMRLSSMASDNEGSYSFSRLWNLFTRAIKDSLSLGFSFLLITILLIVASTLFYSSGIRIYKALRKNFRRKNVSKTQFVRESTNERIKSNMRREVLMLIFSLGLFLGTYYFYRLSMSSMVRILPYPQYTIAHYYVPGIFFSVAILHFLHGFSQLGKRFSEQGRYLLALLAIVHPLYVIAGSNTGIKHSVIALWLLAPLTLDIAWRFYRARWWTSWGTRFLEPLGYSYSPKSRYLAALLIVLVFSKIFIVLPVNVNNFDSPRRRELHYKIDNPKMRYLLTTQTQAEAVNHVLKQFDALSLQDQGVKRPLLIWGGSLLYYYLLDRQAMGWIWPSGPSVTERMLRIQLLETRIERKDLPDVLLCLTDSNRGFDLENYQKQRWEYKRTWANNPKQNVLIEFLERYEYQLVFENKYYAILRPYTEGSFLNMDYRVLFSEE